MYTTECVGAAGGTIQKTAETPVAPPPRIRLATDRDTQGHHHPLPRSTRCVAIRRRNKEWKRRTIAKPNQIPQTQTKKNPVLAFECIYMYIYILIDINSNRMQPGKKNSKSGDAPKSLPARHHMRFIFFSFFFFSIPFPQPLSQKMQAFFLLIFSSHFFVSLCFFLRIALVFMFSFLFTLKYSSRCMPHIQHIYIYIYGSYIKDI